MTSRRGTGVAAEAIHRVAAVIVERDPRERERSQMGKPEPARRLTIEVTIRLWPPTGNDRPYPHGSRYYHQHHPPPSRAD